MARFGLAAKGNHQLILPMTFLHRLLALPVALALGGTAFAQSTEPKPMKVMTNLASEWIPLYGETWWDYYHPDWDGPFSRWSFQPIP